MIHDLLKENTDTYKKEVSGSPTNLPENTNRDVPKQSQTKNDEAEMIKEAFRDYKEKRDEDLNDTTSQTIQDKQKVKLTTHLYHTIDTKQQETERVVPKPEYVLTEHPRYVMLYDSTLGRIISNYNPSAPLGLNNMTNYIGSDKLLESIKSYVEYQLSLSKPVRNHSTKYIDIIKYLVRTLHDFSLECDVHRNWMYNLSRSLRVSRNTISEGQDKEKELFSEIDGKYNEM